MHRSLLKFLVTPTTHKPLTLEVVSSEGDFIEEGFLVSGKKRYPIIRGIPRFSGYETDGEYAKSFSYQWNKWGLVQYESRNIGQPMSGHTRNMWNRIVEPPSSLLNRVVVDWGCGSGRFIEVARERRAIVIGLDLSNAVEVAQEQFRRDPKVLIVQGDALNSPIKDNVADLCYSIGVLHHTPNPSKGLQELVRISKNKGNIAVSVYGDIGHYTNVFVNAHRLVFKKLWPVFGHYPPLLYSYFTAYVLSYIHKIPIVGRIISSLFFFMPYINLKDRRWSLLDTFDSVTPTHQKGCTFFEVYEWFTKAKLVSIRPVNWGGVSLKAIKQ